jgi:hypothetical protein
MTGAKALAASSERRRLGDVAEVGVDAGVGGGVLGGRLITMGISSVTMQMIKNRLLAPQL